MTAYFFAAPFGISPIEIPSSLQLRVQSRPVRFWICDFGFWIVFTKRGRSSIQNRKSKMDSPDSPLIHAREGRNRRRMQKNQGKARDEQAEFQFLHDFLPEAPKEWAGPLYENEESPAELETFQRSTLPFTSSVTSFVSRFTFHGLQPLERLPTP